ncbi:hypothetical protein GCM10010376_75320 [Streptomyces violaceusniger]
MTVDASVRTRWLRLPARHHLVKSARAASQEGAGWTPVVAPDGCETLEHRPDRKAEEG